MFAHHHFPARPPPCPLSCLPAVKRETAKLVYDLLQQTPKPVVLKLRDTVLPACAKLAGAGESDVREAGQAALVAFAVRAGSMSVLDKVGGLVGRLGVCKCGWPGLVVSGSSLEGSSWGQSSCCQGHMECELCCRVTALGTSALYLPTACC